MSPTKTRAAAACVVSCAAVAIWVIHAHNEELAADDECAASSDAADCSLSALQRRTQRTANLNKEAETDMLASDATADTQDLVFETVSESDTQCAELHSEVNSNCSGTIDWIVGGGKWDPAAANWFKDMEAITGVDYKAATKEDFQRLYYCAPPGGKACGAPPCTCSKSPCTKCLSGQMAAAGRKVCLDNPDNEVACVPPKTPMSYKGRSWPTLKYPGTQEMHIFAIGDWGGMDGSLNPPEGRTPIVAYTWGVRPGPSVFPRTRWDLFHEELLCSHKEFIACFNTMGKGEGCPASCGFVEGVDTQPQQLVASAMKERAAQKDPSFFLNVGDNFYWGGIEKTCGTPMGQISWTAHHQFNQIYENVYQGPGLSGKPWLSVLGNHDWGGRVFNNGWDQQIAYTYASERWVMPAVYYMVPVEYPDQDFSVDIYFVDSNFNDAQEPSKDPEHNMCGAKHNPADADCTVMDGPASIESCPQYFADLWTEQKVWLRKKMPESQADWQIMVTHFPCGEDGENQAFYRELHVQHGLDLLITGHRHDQELWLPSMTWKNFMGGLTCFVTGGGGGITSEGTPDPSNQTNWYGEGQYGFYDLTINKTMIYIQSINYTGEVLLNATVYPK
mmetsp:Transcript_68805/g.143695  ORF Transcript_68805/g.143695 Transcript_68805/m.143695 type:complete len:617 (+) Transcript_68805:129-1979(+)|eukprot:CAMPEP_0206442290 /NCGR_PEP_ID=MMETSP0324_2-20121206/13743_1 /ASSEMBLY_ACC=CAM_ASM_000836 /TAXON_ID=2866 /ORGANISM="Crypthecodinium cohnii, Strain Seligo" /LENGTH=616 /DNA_ID=CAMNT_0053910123 /DNA_START=124 /DNA_END=1974 /DNA_ORIENTATION=-